MKGTSEGPWNEQALGSPLSGLRIIDLSTYVAGPSGAMTLAQLGADVIRVDPLGGATDTRRLPLGPDGDSLYWAGLNKGKRSIELDLDTEEGRRIFNSLLAVKGEGNGILLTNSVSHRWLTYEGLLQDRPDLILVHIKGRSDGTPAVDYTVNCEIGLPTVTGPPDSRSPVNHVLPAWDLLTGLHAAIAILTAERTRRRTGRGQSISVALEDVAVATMCHLGFVADMAVNGRSRVRDGNYLYGSFGCDFETADGGRVMVVALTARHWDKIVSMTGLDDTIVALERSLGTDLSRDEARYEHREILAALIRPWFSRRRMADIVAALDEARVLWGTYRTVEEFVVDAASPLARSELLCDVEQPGVGVIPTPRSVVAAAGEHRAQPRPAPRLGEHTGEVLRELLGMQGGALTDLQKRGIIGDSA